MASKARLLVFDWDGTVVDSIARIVECMEHACCDIGRPAPAVDAMRGAIGLSLEQIARQFFVDGGPELWDRFATVYRDRWLAPGRPVATVFPGARQTLEALRSRGFALAVATGKSRRGLDRELDETQLRDLFEATRCADETQSKPHPQMLHEVLEQVGVAADRAAMIGDTVHDLEMAQAADVPSVAVTYGVHSWDELEPWGPRHRIDEVRELLSIYRAPAALR